MQRLLDAANRYVIIYSSDCDDVYEEGKHIKHRKFTTWIAANRPDWALVEHLPNRYPYRGNYRIGERAEFFIYAPA